MFAPICNLFTVSCGKVAEIWLSNSYELCSLFRLFIYLFSFALLKLTPAGANLTLLYFEDELSLFPALDFLVQLSLYNLDNGTSWRFGAELHCTSRTVRSGNSPKLAFIIIQREQQWIILHTRTLQAAAPWLHSVMKNNHFIKIWTIDRKIWCLEAQTEKNRAFL